MILKKYFSDNRAFSLIELLVVMAIISIMLAVGGLTLMPSIDKRKVLNCSSKMISDIQLIRSRAQSDGQRSIFEIAGAGKAADIDGDGILEYYIGFLDNNSNGVHDGGDTVFVKGTNGDQLCSASVSVDPGTTIMNNQIIFDPLGFAMNGTNDQDIYLAGSSTTAARIELVSITGMLRSFANTDNCGDNGCDTNDDWVELQ